MPGVTITRGPLNRTVQSRNVCAAVDPFHTLVPGAARGQHEDRDEDAAIAPAAQHLEPLQLRQAEVEHDGIILFGAAEELRARPIARGVDHVAGRLQHLRQLAGKRRLVLGHQDAHGKRINEVLRGPTRSYEFLRGPTGSYGVLRGPTRSYGVLPGPTGSYEVRAVNLNAG